jgi:hypothetical protein
MKLTASIFEFVNDLDEFSYELSVLDRVWNILFPHQNNKWHHLNVTKYKGTFYITHVNGNGGSLEVEPKMGVHPMKHLYTSSSSVENHGQLSLVWKTLIESTRKWLKVVRRDWIKANQRVQTGYPLRYRYGVAPHALIHASLPVYHLDKELGKKRTRNFVRLVEDGYFLKAENMEVSSMTACDYFKYCRIAYVAGKRKEETVDDSLSGREMYRRYADGRHEGLLDIDPSSEKEFADWIDGMHPKRESGGHPWEIKRGGNTTHIDLTVSRPSLYRKEGFKVELRGESIGRMIETIRMFLAIHEARIPISIADPEGVRKRLLAQDKIGIIPVYAPLHRANQHFSQDEDVFDVMHYDDLGRFKRRITPFIAWETLPILKPADV